MRHNVRSRSILIDYTKRVTIHAKRITFISKDIKHLCCIRRYNFAPGIIFNYNKKLAVYAYLKRLLISIRLFHRIHRLHRRRLCCDCWDYSFKFDLKYKHLSRLRLEQTIERILVSAKFRSMWKLNPRPKPVFIF